MLLLERTMPAASSDELMTSEADDELDWISVAP